MKKLLVVLMCMLMLASCLLLCAYANEETTAAEDTTAAAEEETTEEAAPAERTNDRLVLDLDLISKPNPLQGSNGLNKGSGVSKKGEWEGYKIDIKYPEDPNFTISYQSYFKKYDLTPLTGEDAAFIVLKVAVPEDGYYDDFEIYYCAGDVAAPTEDAKASSDYCDEANGFVYFIYNVDDMWSGKITQLRVDPIGMDEGDVVYLMEIAMFKTEEEAYNWCGFEEEEETEAPSTDAEPEQTTEEKTETVTKMPAKTEKVEDEKEGCGSIVSIGAVVAMITLGAVCIKKRD